MRLYNSFIVTLALLFAAITGVMSAYRVEKLDAYFAAYTLALLLLTALYMTFNRKSQRALSVVGIVAFGGLLVLIALKMFEMLSGRT